MNIADGLNVIGIQVFRILGLDDILYFRFKYNWVTIGPESNIGIEYVPVPVGIRISTTFKRYQYLKAKMRIQGDIFQNGRNFKVSLIIDVGSNDLADRVFIAKIFSGS